ncbi:MAG: DUF1080 domain-containing protein [Puia sp.]|nr:DUF1080 domain-containing protein [Puia sp.]
MKLLYFAFPVLLLGTQSQAQTTNTLTPAEQQAGWKLLFDGTTLNGWHSYNHSATARWNVQNGTIHLDKSKSGQCDITTDQAYGDFDLKLEWKISKNGNSGIIFDVVEAPKYQDPYNTGPEMQVLDNAGHPDGKIFKHRAGNLYDLIPSIKESVKPAGEWNQAEIIVKGGQLTTILNGVVQVKTTMWDANWVKMIAGSKFRQWPDFGTFKTGKIDLQDHTDEVWYRNIKIKQL